MARLTATVCVLVMAVAASAKAQDEPPTESRAPDLTLPPQLSEQPLEAPAAAGETPEIPAAIGQTPEIPPASDSSPGSTRLEAAPEDREDMLEAVVTGGQTDFRLPDLGTSLREEEEIDPNDRIDVTFLYLYDPDNQDPAEEVFPTIEDLRRVGFLRVFEMRFGRRSRE